MGILGRPQTCLLQLYRLYLVLLILNEPHKYKLLLLLYSSNYSVFCTPRANLQAGGVIVLQEVQIWYVYNRLVC